MAILPRSLDPRWLWGRLRSYVAADRRLWILLAGMSVYAVVLSVVAVARLTTFQTHAFDLGIFNQAFSTALDGRLFYETPDVYLIPSGSFLGTHFNLLMVLLLPIYALAPGPETLLVLQTVFIALGALPVFLVARRLLPDSRLPLFFAALYLVNPATMSLNFYDFHLEAFLPFFLGMFYYAYLAGRWKMYAGFLVLSVFTIDFAAVIVGSIALTHLVRHMTMRFRTEEGRPAFRIRIDLDPLRLRILLVTLVLSPIALYAILSTSAYFAGAGRPLSHTLTGFLGHEGLLDTLHLRVAFWLLIYASLMFLPWFALRECVVSLPWLVLTLLPVPTTWYIYGSQYPGAFVVPFLLLAAVHGVRRIHGPKDVRSLLAAAIVVSAFLAPLNPLMQGVLPGIAYEQGLPLATPHDAILNEALALIPPHASVLTQNSLFTQVSSRIEAYLYLPDGTGTPDYVFADTTRSDYALDVWGLDPVSTVMPRLMSTGAYGILAMSDGVFLLAKGYTGPLAIAGPTEYRYDYRTLSLQHGDPASDATSSSSTVFVYGSGNLTPLVFWRGPRAHLPPGRYTAMFQLKTGAAAGALTVDVSLDLNKTTTRVLAAASLSPYSFATRDTWQPFVLPFTLSYADAPLPVELRGASVSGGPFSLDYVLAAYLGPP